MKRTLPEKTCRRCGRTFSWRKKWALNWDEVVYCSDACRRKKLRGSDDHRERRIVRALSKTNGLALALEDIVRSPEELEPLRQAARRLAINGRIRIVQSGKTVEPRTIRGPIFVASCCDYRA